jgi:hypothetical protein
VRRILIRHGAAFGAKWRGQLADGREGQSGIRCGFALDVADVAYLADSAAWTAAKPKRPLVRAMCRRLLAGSQRWFIPHQLRAHGPQLA